MSSDNVNAAADDSFVFDDKANFEEDYTEKPKEFLEMIGLKGGGKNITKQLKKIGKNI